MLQKYIPSGVDEKKRNRKTGGLPRRLQIDPVYTLLTEREKRRRRRRRGRGRGGWRRKGAWVASLSLVDATMVYRDGEKEEIVLINGSARIERIITPFALSYYTYY